MEQSRQARRDGHCVARPSRWNQLDLETAQM
jgi:hypothetical protein